MRVVKLDETPHLRILFYGSPGSTKTRTVSTAAWDERTAPALMLEAGGNPHSIRDYDKYPTILHLERVKDLNGPYDWFLKGQPEDHVFARKYGLEPGYKSIILDSVTDIQRIVIDEVTNRTGKRPGDSLDMLGRQGFGQILARVLHMTRLYFELPVHVFMTCLEDDKESGYRPMLWGQAAGEVPGYAYAVGRLAHYEDLPPRMRQAFAEQVAAAESDYISLWSKHSKYFAKDQYGALGNYMFDTTIPRIVDKIYGEAP